MSGFDTYLYLNGPSGDRIAQDDDSLGNYGSLIEVTLGTTGTYTIVAAGYGSSSGSYTLTLRDTTPPPPQVRAIQIGAAVTGAISPRGHDQWTFVGSPGQRVRIEMSGFDTYLYLQDPSGDRIAQDDDSLGGYGSLIERTLTRSGSYTIIAAGYGMSSGSYRLTVRLIASAPPPPAAPPQPAPFARPTRGYLGACWDDPDPRARSGGGTNHTGIDVWSDRTAQGPQRQPVYAVYDGVVRTAASPRIEITLDALPSSYSGSVPQLSGLAAYYTHLSEIWVRPGQRVARGQQIGVQGDVGGNGIIHLHFSVKKRPGASELYIANTWDPSTYLRMQLSWPSCGVNTTRWGESF